ncbi:AGE family epimerase/isomerase [Candidatus Sumerlaeota bacterium]|nr:AGE family epimerase/isomerase [Candidatus Sumerlaeota bacterium]
MTGDPKNLAQILRRHLCADILPFWFDFSIDHDQGGFITNLERDGQRSGDLRKNLVMQARMIDAFTVGARIAGDSRYLDAARQGFRFLSQTMMAVEDNRWLAVVERDGTPVVERIRAFNLTAVVHALAGFAQATDEARALELALETFEQLELFLWDATYEGYYEGLDAQWQVDETTKSLDSHLHAVEALFALVEAANDDAFEDTSWRLLDLIMRRMTVGADGGPLVEKFTDSWAEEADECEPTVKFGHLFKAVWLFLDAYRRTHHASYLDFARAQLSHALVTGIDPEAGVFETADTFGEIADARHFWWTQCEAIAALARAWSVDGKAEHLGLLERLVDYCLEHFHDKRHGEWFALLGPRGAVLDDRKGHDRKSAYPIVRCLHSAILDLES